VRDPEFIRILGTGVARRRHERGSRPEDLTVEAERHVPLATILLVRYDLPESYERYFFDEDEYWLDLCLGTRPLYTRACYEEYWSPRRFEPIGDMLLVPPGKALRVLGSRGEHSSILCLLHSESIRDWLEDEFEWTDRILEATLDLSSPSIRKLVLRLGQELRCPGIATQILTELIAGQIAIEMFRHAAAINDGPTRGGLTPWRLRIIDERLAERCDAPTLAELAELCDLSVRQLARGFRTSRDCSIGDYVARSQIGHAKRLLATDESVKSVAYTLGYASPSNFSCAFRRATGQTPRQFRRRLRNGE
jgi:AraC family transcriptional regulator